MLSFMAMDYFAKSPVLSMPILALGLFMTAFMTVIVRAALSDAGRIARLSNLPLEDGARTPDAEEKRP